MQSAIYGSDIGKYRYNMVENLGPLTEMQGKPTQNFYGGRYNVEVLTEDRIFYRGGYMTEEDLKSVKNFGLNRKFGTEIWKRIL